MDGQEIRVVHAIPGRLRLKVASVKRQPGLADDIERALSRLDGIDVEVSPVTGSVLLTYGEGGRANGDGPLASLRESFRSLFPDVDLQQLLTSPLPHDTERNGHRRADPAEPASLAKRIAEFFASANEAIADWTDGFMDMRILVPSTLFLVGVALLILSESLAFPVWYEFLWFAFTAFIALCPMLTPRAALA